MSLPTLLLILASYVTHSWAQNLGSPTDYAPKVNQTCPEDPLIRVFSATNQSLNQLEFDYVTTREKTVIAEAWPAWLGDGSGIGYNLSVFNGTYPRIGIGLAGGGHRAALYGAGVLNALDARNSSSVAAGTGGMLQTTTYLSALSGGGWLTGSLYFNDFPQIHDMILGNGGNLSGWLLDLNLATPGGVDLFNNDNQWFFGSILWSVIAKANQSIYTSLADPWSRMIAYHYLNGSTESNFFTNDSAHGAGILWSDMPKVPSFAQYQVPFPMLMADSRPINSSATTALTPEPVVYEISPAEFGSWDPNLSAMVNLTYAGTHLDNGKPPNSTGCVTGFDQASFMMGTSAMILNQILDFAHNTLDGLSDGDSKSLFYVLARQLTDVRMRADDVANWPNPFQNIKPDTFEDSNSTWLDLIDGSSNGENVPLGSLFVKARGIDVVVAVDDTANDPVNDWPNGTSPLFTQSRIQNLLLSSHQTFPPIPSSSAEFISTGVNQRPTFFGCDPPTFPPPYPLMVYLPNSPPNNGDKPITNTATFRLSYTAEDVGIFLDQVQLNTAGGFVPNKTGSDPNWGKCLQCAAIDRARWKVPGGVPRSDFCQTCFKQYCFDPNNPPSSSEVVGRDYVFFDPDPTGLSAVEEFFKNHKVPLIIGLVLLVLVIIGAAFGIRYWRKRKQQRYELVTKQLDNADAPWHAYTELITPRSPSPSKSPSPPHEKEASSAS